MKNEVEVKIKKSAPFKTPKRLRLQKNLSKKLFSDFFCFHSRIKSPTCFNFYRYYIIKIYL